MSLSTVTGGDTTTHTPIAVANAGAALTFPGYTPGATSSVAYFINSNFKLQGGFSGTLTPGPANAPTQYAACFSYDNNAVAVYANYETSGSPWSMDNAVNTFASAFTPSYRSGNGETWAVFAHTATLGDGLAASDPFFHGFWDQEFYIHGRAGAVYNLLSDRHVQLNARFVFLSNVTCPTLSAEELSKPPKVHCSSHPGTYFGEMGLKSVSGDGLYIRAGAVTVGFDQVSVNGQAIAVGQSYGAPPLDSVQHELHTSSAVDGVEATEQSPHSHPARSTLYVHRTSARSLIVHAGLYEVLIENSDKYVDLVTVHVTSWPELLDVVQPSGLLGVTWNNTTAIPPSEEHHRERDDELMGCNMPSDKHCAERLTAQQ